MQTNLERKMDWSGRLEQLEDRLAMSADPVGGYLGGIIEHHDLPEEPPAIEHHLQSGDALGGSIEHHFQSMPDFWIDSDDQAALDAQLREIEQALANAHDQTGLTQVRNDYGLTGAGQTVAIIDSGIAYDHFALGGGFGDSYRVVGGWDFTGENDADPYDDGPEGSHGTHVSGIVGGDDGSRSGVAPGVDLVGLRVFDDAGAGYFSWVENALGWIHDNRDSFENPITAVNLSLGVSSWNSDTIPIWATLEDEFAQLEADGIFIAVSAGNAFTTYNEPGLSYPAASSHVVPVMSVTDSGLLSYFSQRHSRAIAAPGQGILSTVPDYVGNDNGITDDYSTFSGTSMASPYVAGASVIIREAMEFVGYTGITQSTIYDHMTATADTFYDTVTDAWYNRLNVDAAIDALMPADDFGSSVATAYDLGTVSDPISIGGLIGTLDDIDYFRFTAGNTGTVTFEATNTTHNLTASWIASAPQIGDSVTLDVVAGQDYTVGLASGDGIGYFDFDVTAVPSITFTDWGTVSFLLQNDVWATNDTWYRVEATSGGFLTAEALFDAGGGQINLELYDSSMQQIDSGTAVGGESRVEGYVAAGEEFFLRVLGENSDVDFRITNLVSLDGTTVNVAGTAGDDAFAFTAGATHQVSVNGVTYDFASISITDVSFDGGTGYDSIAMTGTTGDETATLRVGDAVLTGNGFVASALNVEDVTVYGAGGSDTADLYDSTGDDTLVATRTYVEFSSQGSMTRVESFARVNAYSLSGGYDRAYLYDSTGDDRFVGRPEYALLDASTYYNLAYGFDRVDAYIIHGGGNDRAYLYDSAGDDRFVGRPEYSLLDGNGFFNVVHGFDRVDALANAGGDNDRVTMYDSSGNDVFVARPEYSLMSGAGFYNFARGFDRTDGFANAGGTNDIAYLYDSAGSDQFVGREAYSLLSGGGFYNLGWYFEKVYAYANSGGAQDLAYFYDSAGDDRFIGQSDYSSMSGSGFYYYAKYFDQLYAYSSGGSDLAEMYDTAGDDLFSCMSNSCVFTGSGLYNSALNFDNVRIYSDNGGFDELKFLDAVTGDTFNGSGSWGQLLRSDSIVDAYDLDSIKLYDAVGESATVNLGVVDYLFEQLGG